MVVKKSVQCGECKKYIDFYIEEEKSLKGIKVKCECGCNMECIDYNKHISRWR